MSWVAVMVPVAKLLRNDCPSPEVEEVPLRSRLSLHLHGPHEPANTLRPRLVTVNLRDEIFLQEVLVVIGVA